MSRAAVACTLALACALGRASGGDPIPAVARSPRRKLIEVGWDMPDTRFLRERHKEMEATTPFDGVVFRAVAKSPSGEVCDTNAAWDARPWKREWFEPALEDLRACAFEKFTDNFVRLNATPGSLDWFDDRGWAALEEKVRILAWLAREGGAKGICLDPESYGERQFQFRAASGHTFSETAAAARRRGAQFLRALAEEHPSATLLSFWLGSLNLAAGRSRDPEAILAAEAYGLFAPFVDGLCDALRPGITLVDGCEHGYYMDSAESYLRAFRDLRSWDGPALRLLSPENRAKYLAQGRAGFGFYLDMFLNPPGHRYSFPDDGIPRLRRLERNLRSALAASDGCVWVYGEQCRWWPIEDPDPERKRLPHTVGKGRLWEEAMPGIRRAIEWARDPRSAAVAEVARRRGEGSLENLLSNPTFEPGRVQANGLPAEWGAWQAEGSRGAFSLDPEVGRSAPGAAKASGVRDGCLLAKRRVRPGERYAVEARALSRAGAIPSVRVRWQTLEGSWTEERLDVVLVFEPDPAGSDWRWAFDAVEVPERAGFLVLLLVVRSPAPDGAGELAGGASGTPTAWFDDAGLYSVD